MLSRVAAPLLLAGAALAAPAGTSPAATQTCSSKFTGWTVSDLVYNASYIFTTPAHQNSYGYVSFSLHNPAVAQDVQCSGMGSQLENFFYGTQVYQCAPPDNSNQITWTYDFPTGTLAVNQTWVCRDDDPKFPATFHAGGHIASPPQCTDTTWTNPNWTIGQIYSDRTVACAPVTLPMKADFIYAVA